MSVPVRRASWWHDAWGEGGQSGEDHSTSPPAPPSRICCRLTGGWDTVADRDPMAAWYTNRNRPVPYALTGHDDSPAPWKPARLLDGGGPYSIAPDHTLAVCARRLLPADTPVTATLLTPTHTSLHKSNVRSLDVTHAELGTVGQLADPETRAHLARISRTVDDTAERLLRAARRVWSRHQRTTPSDTLTPRLIPTDIESAWMETVEGSHPGHLEAILTQWGMALDASAEPAIDALPLPAPMRAEIALAFHQHEPPSRAPKQGVADFNIFGAWLSLSQISQHPQCLVTYNTLRKRVDKGWDVLSAATTPAKAGRASPARTRRPPATGRRPRDSAVLPRAAGRIRPLPTTAAPRTARPRPGGARAVRADVTPPPPSRAVCPCPCPLVVVGVERIETERTNRDDTHMNGTAGVSGAPERVLWKGAGRYSFQVARVLLCGLQDTVDGAPDPSAR
ncbi:hypothetical protein M1P56_16965 [Streptomyces sp. HU2014]|uniref:hypothetical protein n=1 Tax=Streptomyces sp. HU2014 TaxID=2939414 RepID=UPI00200D588D|nr:hypothetical protein [Streptomyces sp. HU2014]UQI45926.1 hypothetical protein M1P56_16965 [Streptomyces sp. HU2014]